MPPKKGAAQAAVRAVKRRASTTKQSVAKRQNLTAAVPSTEASSSGSELSPNGASPSMDVPSTTPSSTAEAVSPGLASTNGDASSNQIPSSTAEAVSPGIASTSMEASSTQVSATSADVSSSEVTASTAQSGGQIGSWVPQTKSQSAMQEKLIAAAAINAAKPRPFGQPPVFAESRQALCESLPYYRAYQSSAYINGGRVYGVMLDYAEDSSAYMDEEIIVHKTGGGCRITNDAIREQVVEHKRSDAIVQAFLKSWENHDPLVVILGSRNIQCPSSMPHRYNVLGWFVVTHVWPERTAGKTAFKVRLQKIDLAVKSWWAAENTPPPPQMRDFNAKALRQCCQHCDQPSSHIYTAGWMCLNEKCNQYCQIRGKPITKLVLNPEFLAERFDQKRRPSTVLVPNPITNNSGNPFLWVTRAAWRGVPCALCGNCIAAKHWHFWECEAPGCGWKYALHHPVLSQTMFQPNGGMGFSEHAIIENTCNYPFEAWTYQIHGNYLISIYRFMPGNYTIQIHASNLVNSAANYIYTALQADSAIPLQRNLMSGPSVVEGGMLTKHFAVNYGAQYKYVAAVGMLPFSEAAKPIMKALGRITWACSYALGLIGVTEYEKPNELLAVGYKEGNEMGYHDDGETGLGITVGSLSLGGEADFNFRMKDGYWSPRMMTDPKKYDPNKEVLEGSKLWKERQELNAKYGQIPKADFELEKEKLYAKWKEYHHEKPREGEPPKDHRGKECPTLLNLKLKHGDYVIMHGAEIQKYFEHAAKPSDKLRFALTARTIDMDLAKIPESARWNADFTLKDDEIYNPDLSNSS